VKARQILRSSSPFAEGSSRTERAVYAFRESYYTLATAVSLK